MTMSKVKRKRVMKYADWVVARSAGLMFDGYSVLQQVQTQSFLHPQMVGQARSEILAKDQAYIGMAPGDRLALPGLRERSPRHDPKRRAGLENAHQRKGGRNQGPNHRAGRPGVDGQGMPDPRPLRRPYGH